MAATNGFTMLCIMKQKSEWFSSSLIGTTLKCTNTFVSTSLHQWPFCHIQMPSHRLPGLRQVVNQGSETHLGFNRQEVAQSGYPSYWNGKLGEHGRRKCTAAPRLPCNCGTIIGAEINFRPSCNIAEAGEYGGRGSEHGLVQKLRGPAGKVIRQCPRV